MESDHEIMAKTIYGEARGEGCTDQEKLKALSAVAHVIKNRVHAKTWYGTTIQAVCQKPYQFSCWNKNDPNRRLLEREEVLQADPIYHLCLLVAQAVIKGYWQSQVGLSTHYPTTSIKPSWSKGKKADYTLHHHCFYEDLSCLSSKVANPQRNKAKIGD